MTRGPRLMQIHWPIPLLVCAFVYACANQLEPFLEPASCRKGSEMIVLVLHVPGREDPFTGALLISPGQGLFIPGSCRTSGFSPKACWFQCGGGWLLIHNEVQSLIIISLQTISADTCRVFLYVCYMTL